MPTRSSKPKKAPSRVAKAPSDVNQNAFRLMLEATEWRMPLGLRARVRSLARSRHVRERPSGPATGELSDG